MHHTHTPTGCSPSVTEGHRDSKADPFLRDGDSPDGSVWLEDALKALLNFPDTARKSRMLPPKLLSFTGGPMAHPAFSASPPPPFSITGAFLLISSHVLGPTVVPASPRTQPNTSETRSGLRKQAVRRGFGAVSPAAAREEDTVPAGRWRGQIPSQVMAQPLKILPAVTRGMSWLGRRGCCGRCDDSGI